MFSLLRPIRRARASENQALYAQFRLISSRNPSRYSSAGATVSKKFPIGLRFTCCHERSQHTIPTGAHSFSPGRPPALNSWKEIASYFDRDIRTVQLWEKKEGLPVHRHEHDARSSVYALPSELETWFAHRSKSPSATPAEPTPSPSIQASENAAALAPFPQHQPSAASRSIAFRFLTVRSLAPNSVLGWVGLLLASLALASLTTFTVLRLRRLSSTNPATTSVASSSRPAVLAVLPFQDLSGSHGTIFGWTASPTISSPSLAATARFKSYRGARPCNSVPHPSRRGSSQPGSMPPFSLKAPLPTQKTRPASQFSSSMPSMTGNSGPSATPAPQATSSPFRTRLPRASLPPSPNASPAGLCPPNWRARPYAPSIRRRDSTTSPATSFSTSAMSTGFYRLSTTSTAPLTATHATPPPTPPSPTATTSSVSGAT